MDGDIFLPLLAGNFGAGVLIFSNRLFQLCTATHNKINATSLATHMLTPAAVDAMRVSQFYKSIISNESLFSSCPKHEPEHATSASPLST